MKLPATGRSAASILDELDTMQADDVDWKSGRAFSLDDSDEAAAGGGDDALPDFMKADADTGAATDDTGDDKE